MWCSKVCAEIYLYSYSLTSSLFNTDTKSSSISLQRIMAAILRYVSNNQDQRVVLSVEELEKLELPKLLTALSLSEEDVENKPI